MYLCVQKQESPLQVPNTNIIDYLRLDSGAAEKSNWHLLAKRDGIPDLNVVFAKRDGIPDRAPGLEQPKMKKNDHDNDHDDDKKNDDHNYQHNHNC